jgi:hypothetical protein
MTKEQARAVLDAIIDDGSKETGIPFCEGVFDAPHRQQVLYYALCALVEAIMKEVQSFSLEESFAEAAKNADSWLCYASVNNCYFNNDWHAMADWRMQEVLRIGNELGTPTQLCAKLHQIILEDAEYPVKQTRKIYSGNIITEILNFMLKMAYGEILKLVDQNGMDVLSTLNMWQEMPISSEYFRRAFINLSENDELAIELPTVEEANSANWALQMSPYSMPLLAEAFRVYERIARIS